MYAWVDLKAVIGLKEYASPISRDWKTWLLPLLTFVPFIYFVFFTPYVFRFGLLFVFLYFWLVYGVNKVPHKESADPVLRKIRSALIAAPVLAVAAFVAGQVRGDAALAPGGIPYKLKIKGGEPRNRELLRSFDKGLLVRSPADERVEFIRWDQIEEVTRTSPKERSEPISCQLFNFNCFKEQITP
ncbi:MAG: hypothetical protein K2Z81_14015, partial [Cyanobacteria bacterium]|nr:hypothetical protein [Cyanobacteriota bacterium]